MATVCIRILSILCLSFVISGCETVGQQGVPSAADGVRELLRLSTQRATEKLALKGGYEDSEDYQIQIAGLIKAGMELLRAFGMNDVINDVEKQVNRSAELVAAEANEIFVKEIRTMRIDDALSIIQGGGSSATDYFERRTRADLRGRYGELVRNQLTKLDFYSTYRSLITAYKLLPLPNKPELDVETLAIDMGLDALFSQMAEEEKKIRKNPAELGSVLLSTLLQGR